jgi:hypothetical protein
MKAHSASPRWTSLLTDNAILFDPHKPRVLYMESSTGAVPLPVDAVGPDERRLLFRRTPAGLEPLALWLSVIRMPRRAHSWQSTFRDANVRVQAVWEASGGRGQTPLFFRAHVARHSFALKW